MSDIPNDITETAKWIAGDQCGADDQCEYPGPCPCRDQIANALLTERQRATRNPHPAFLIASKHVLNMFENPRAGTTQYTAVQIEELRAAVAEAESVPNLITEGA